MNELDRQNLNTDNAEAIIRAFDNTDICIFTYYPDKKTVEIPKRTCDKYQCRPIYTNMPDSFAEDFVYQDDYSEFFLLYKKINGGEETATAQFHSKDFCHCCRVTLTTHCWTKDKAPAKAVGIIEDVTEAYKEKQLALQMQRQLFVAVSNDDKMIEARKLISTVISGQYYAIYHIWLESRTYICFQEKLHGVLSIIGEQGEYEPAWESYIEKFIEPEDQEIMREFSNIETLEQRLSNKNSITCIYRRKGVGWTRGQFVAAKRSLDGKVTNVIYTVIDINAEKNRELMQQKALYESQHDSMTGVLNRKGFKDVVASQRVKNCPVGFVIIDVDNFKMINDTCGHEMGDRILVAIAKMLQGVFRNEDIVFRLGGDEFAVLIWNCNESFWTALCEKQQHIHTAVASEFSDVTVTLSAGVCFSENGYSERLYQLADDALYETKRNGRAGCTMINVHTGDKKCWNDTNLSVRSQNILGFNNTGLFRVEYPLKSGDLPRMICGEAIMAMFGFPNDASPEKVYQLWHDGIDKTYLEALSKARMMIMNGVQAECTYQWNHSIWGEMFIRTGGTGEVANGTQILYGYHHFMKDTQLVERDDDNRLMVGAMSGIYFCSYYVDIEKDSYYAVKIAPGERYLNMQENKATATLNSFISVLVHPDYREKMVQFTDLTSLPDRMKNELHLDCEYMSCTDKGWCRASFFPVKRDAYGSITHVLFVVTSLDANKAREAEEGINNRKSVEALYNNVPGGIVMYEWDGKKLKTLHFSGYYARLYGESMNDNGSPDYRRIIHPDDTEAYKQAIRKALSETHRLEHAFRVWNPEVNRYIWMKLNAVSKDQPDGTSLVYAMYSDITEQKDAELRLEKNHAALTAAFTASNLLGYEYDPDTHTGVCFTDENFFGLPKVIENYPDSLRDIDLFHPEDADLFIRTAHSMDDGHSKGHCNVRIKKCGKYNWYSCVFDAYYDSEKERNVAILTVTDISGQMNSVKGS